MATEKRNLVDIDACGRYVAGRMGFNHKSAEDVMAYLADFADKHTVDAVEVPDKELLKAIRLLIKQYEHSKNSDYVHSPVAHALFHTWKQVEERRTDNA